MRRVGSDVVIKLTEKRTASIFKVIQEHLSANVSERYKSVFLDYPKGSCGKFLRMHQSKPRHIP